MAYKNIVFVKLEKRLLNDYRWFTMSDNAQLLYVKLMLLAAETYNKIPKNDNVLREALRCRLELKDFQNCLNEVKANFPKLKENKHFMYFDEFEHKTNYLPAKQSLSNRSAIAQQGADKEEDKEKEKEEDKDNKKRNLDEPIIYLNEKAKTKYDPKNKANRDLIKARFLEGRTLDQFKAVIDKKVAEWLTDEKMHKYLRPSTLFSRTHFEEYLNEPEPKKKSLIEQYEVKK